MSEFITVTAKTVKDAILEASLKLETFRDNIEYEVIEEGSSGFLGIGAKQAVIKATLKVEEKEEASLKPFKYYDKPVVKKLIDVTYPVSMDDEVENKDNIELNKDNIIKLSNDYKENQNLIDYAIKLKPDRLAIDSLSLNNTYYIIEAIDLGYKGIIGTINSDSTEDSIDKIKRDILLKDSSYDDKKLLEVVSQSIDILINIKELRDNNKKVIEISEVDKKTLKIKKIFTFKETGLDLEGNIVGKYIINNEAKIYDYLKENNIIKADYLFNKSKVVIKENDIEEFNPVSKKTAQEKRKEYYRKVLDKKNKEKKKLKKKAQSK